MAAKAGPRRITVPTLQILSAFMAEPTRSDWFGFDLCRKTGLRSGTVVQALFRLEQWGWVESRWEDEVEAQREGRPRRRFYWLTGLGRQEAVELLQRRFFGALGWNPA